MTIPRMGWDKCLSHEIFDSLEKGWQGCTQNIYWGLGGDNFLKIKYHLQKKENFYYVDVGYLTSQITRYPEPIIHDYEKTYFRICKNSIHTQNLQPSNGERLAVLAEQGIPVEPTENDGGNKILVCPSSPTVSNFYGYPDRNDWLRAQKFPEGKVVLRDKPRVGNPWWGTKIQDDLKNCKLLVTMMSLAGVDAVLQGVPTVAHPDNVVSQLDNFDTEKDWLASLADNQFTLEEMENGTAWQLLHS